MYCIHLNIIKIIKKFSVRINVVFCMKVVALKRDLRTLWSV